MSKQMSEALKQGDQTPVVLIGKNETDLVDSRELRDSLVEHEVVFEDERVKALGAFLLPKDFGATTEQVANYFEIPKSTIDTLVSENFEEISLNGYEVISGERLTPLKGVGAINARTAKIGVFQRRAILNVAMLLRDSPVAKTIRSILLDATENKTVVKEIVKDQQIDMTQLSPSLQAFGQLFQSMAQVELNQKQMQMDIQETKQEVQAMRDIVTLNPNAWREETTNLVNKIAAYRGGTHNIYQETRQEIYDLLDSRFRVDLETRLRNLRRRMAEEGVSKSKRDKTNKLDVISSDPKLIEGYTQVVKEMAIKYGVS